MCSNRCANPVRPIRSFADPTWYQRFTATSGAVWSSERVTNSPFGNRKVSIGSRIYVTCTSRFSGGNPGANVVRGRSPLSGTPGRSVTADGDGYNRSSGPGRRARTGVSHQARCPVRQGMAPAAKIYGSSNAKVWATIIIGTLMDSLRTYASAWALLAEIGLVFVGEVYASTPYWVERMRSLSM
jgi:hypothetical protein